MSSSPTARVGCSWSPREQQVPERDTRCCASSSSPGSSRGESCTLQVCDILTKSLPRILHNRLEPIANTKQISREKKERPINLNVITATSYSQLFRCHHQIFARWREESWLSTTGDGANVTYSRAFACREPRESASLLGKHDTKDRTSS